MGCSFLETSYGSRLNFAKSGFSALLAIVARRPLNILLGRFQPVSSVVSMVDNVVWPCR